MFGIGKQKVLIRELAEMLFLTVVSPESAAQDWETVRTSGVDRNRFEVERLLYRTFVTLGVADLRLRERDWQALIDVYGWLFTQAYRVEPLRIQERVTQYINAANSGGERLRYGTVADSCEEFALVCGKPGDPRLINLADRTALELGRVQLSILDQVKVNAKDLVPTTYGTIFKSSAPNSNGSQSVFCTHCGIALQSNMRYCSNCGQPQFRTCA